MYCSGKYVIKGDADGELWKKHRDSIVGNIEMKWSELEDYLVLPDDCIYHNDDDIVPVRVDIWGECAKVNRLGREHCLGDLSELDEYYGKDGSVSVSMYFFWSESRSGPEIPCALFEEIMGRVKKYRILDKSSTWIFISDLDDEGRLDILDVAA